MLLGAFFKDFSISLQIENVFVPSLQIFQWDSVFVQMPILSPISLLFQNGILEHQAFKLSRSMGERRGKGKVRNWLPQLT